MVCDGADELFYGSVDLRRSQDGVLVDTSSRGSSDVRRIPATEPETEALVVRPRQPDLEYSLDHWGDLWVVLTNLDATDFRMMTAPLHQPAEWTELVPHTPGRRLTAV